MVEHKTPEALDIIPVSDDAVLDGVSEVEDPGLGASLITDESVLGLGANDRTG
jgi:hypothetical protein